MKINTLPDFRYLGVNRTSEEEIKERVVNGNKSYYANHSQFKIIQFVKTQIEII